MATAVKANNHPLSPPNTSSPRATLHSFIDNMNTAIKGWREKTDRAETYRAFRRAVDTLDFSTTPNDSATAVQIERIIMLKEILDRLDLPPYDMIPDTTEVSKKDITRWTIPDTKIKIVRIENGPQEGEFLFSADTVQHLDQYYKRIKEAPYKANATAGIYEEIINGKNTAYSFERRARFRLRPVDTSSPRATLDGFLSSVNRAFNTIMQVRSSHSSMSKKEILKAQEAAEDLFERAIATLDLRKVPEEHRKDVGIESVLLLKEIIDRMPLPPEDFIPDAVMVAAQLALHKESSGKAYQYHWRFPNTEIEIVEISEGAKQGQFLFSAETVARLKDFYAQIKNHPYRPNYLAGASPEDYLPSKQSKGFYKFYISTPGILVPQAHFLSGIISSLPESFKKLYGEQTLWQWVALALCLTIILFVTYTSFKFIWLPAKSKEKPLKNWLRLLVPIIIMITIHVFVVFLDEDINLTGDVLTVVFGGGKSLMIIVSAWAAFAFCKAIAETIISSPQIPPQSINATILRLGSRVVGALIGAMIIIKGGQRLGIDMLPLLAGFGVGGLAVALAAKQTFANIIGSLILLFNKPVKVGDFCRYGDQLGTVEHIGLISTRIRSLERTVITVPNADFSEMHLDNFQLRDQRLFKTVLQLRYETTPEQMRWVLVKLRELLLSHPMISPDPARVRFTGYGAFSKDILIFAYFYCQDQNTFLAIQEDILLRIEDIINESGSGFAFPSQTIYTCRDEGINKEQGQQAEAEVQEWRSKDQLPFPDFAEERLAELRDSLDYPPEGSQSKRPPSGPSTPLTKVPKK
ncbi:mechanosensitive ion channel family protein [Halodesulfovibrio aestuarii]|uniref:mechanosensitive ion channel family protein n=1 Tax=Halodesulfovibrio aestuarii TaxID=126333 RepID=UPI003D35170B